MKCKIISYDDYLQGCAFVRKELQLLDVKEWVIDSNKRKVKIYYEAVL